MKRKLKTLFGGLFREKIRPDILRQTLGEHRLLCVCFALGLLLFACCMAVLNRPPAEPPRYELATFGGEIDFDAPDIIAHTAADGVAVIRPGASLSAADNSPSAETEAMAIPAAPVMLTADPAAIWQSTDAASAPTHGGFTLPVAMDGESIGVLTIPDLGLTVRAYESDDEMADMTKGVAHFKSTSAWDGNIALSGHNINFDNTPGYFLNLYTLEPGAVIRYDTAHGSREYAVESVTEIAETDWTRLGRTEDNRITLITCISGKPSLRLCVQAVEKQS